jgi:hypothetical protein
MVHRRVARDCPRFSGEHHSEAERQAAAEAATIRASYPLPEYCFGALTYARVATWWRHCAR